ncbi:Serine/threonine-protein kinase, partial [Colletotrichum tropicale]
PHDSIDFTDNDIQVLGNFPLSPRISTLLLARNRVSSIQPTLPNAIPNLQQLVLAANNLAELADLDTLAGFKRLTHLVLADNPVTKRENYRYWVVWRCPTVRFLDYSKVKEAEREKARELFGTAEEPSALASKVCFFFYFSLEHSKNRKTNVEDSLNGRSWASSPRRSRFPRRTARRPRRSSRG